MTSRADSDRDLLRRFEPVMRFTAGEQFFPINIDPYVRASSLWVQRRDADPVLLVPEGQLSLERLAEPRAHGFEAVYYLRFIEPLNIAAMAAATIQDSLTRKDPKDVFHAGPGRLTRVGYGSRFIDAVFTLTLLARGRVPGDTALAAIRTCKRMRTEQQEFCYYGRVVRRDGWVVLQYWFFYPFNDWRSGFFGVNDHEADWESICIFLSETPDGEVNPEWVAYAAHEFAGDDLRRRWDDPEVDKVGEHPVIYVGAGSHASYFARGEYIIEIEIPFLAPLVRLVDRLQDAWRRMLRQARGDRNTGAGSPAFNVFRIPFVDYARGDGFAIGPGGDAGWCEPALIEPPPAWVEGYRGLWGLYAADPIAGEDAPAGPMYNRDGTVRRSWYDPLGWAGLDKVPPPDEELQRIQEQLAVIEARCTAASQAIAEKSRDLVGLGVEAAAMLGRFQFRRQHAAHRERIAALSRDLNALRAQQTEDQSLLEALQLRAAELRAGERGPARAHIYRAHHPASDAGLRLSVFAEVWAAISIGVLMLSLVAMVVFARQYLIYGLSGLLALIIFVEAGFRRQLSRLVTSVTNALAIVAALVLIFQFFWEIVIALVLLAGTYLMWENLKELRR